MTSVTIEGNNVTENPYSCVSFISYAHVLIRCGLAIATVSEKAVMTMSQKYTGFTQCANVILSRFTCHGFKVITLVITIDYKCVPVCSGISMNPSQSVNQELSKPTFLVNIPTPLARFPII